MAWLLKVILSSAAIFVLAWSLILTLAQNSPSFPESFYSVAIIGPLAAALGENLISAALAAVPTFLFYRLAVVISRDPEAILRLFSSSFDITSGIMGNEIGIRFGRLNQSKDESAHRQPDDIRLDHEQLIELEAKVVSAITEKNGYALIAMIENRFGKKAIEEAQAIGLQDSISQVHAELTEERRVVSSRSGINLLIGIIFASAGISILVYTFFTINPTDEANIVAIAFRATLAISAQIFAYFFLSLYRTGLSDVKFFRNEVTNIGLMKVGLLLAIQRGNPEDISEISRRLVATERNFILKKGETTASLSRYPEDIGSQAAGLIEKGAEIARKVVADKQ